MSSRPRIRRAGRRLAARLIQPARKEYPKVNSEGRGTFCIGASKAKSVGVSFKDSGEFIKGEDGAWYGVARPLDVGFHYYTIKIDGADVPDLAPLAGSGTEARA